MEKGRIEFDICHLWNRGEILNYLAMFKYLSTLTKIVYFLRPFEEKKCCGPMDKGRIELKT